MSGVVMAYGDLGDRNEVFRPGSLVREPQAWLNVLHDPKAVVGWEGGGGVTFTDTAEALTVRAELPRIPAADLALEGIRAGTLNGLSVEFEALAEHRQRQTGTRVLERARFYGAGIVEAPSYGLSRLEARQRTGPRLAGLVQLEVRVSCSCRDGTDAVRMKRDAFDGALREAEAGRREVTAFMSGRFDRPVARLGSSMRVQKTRNALRVEVDRLPDTREVAEFVETVQTGGRFTVRPYFQDRLSDITREGTTAVVRRADLRGFEIAAITGPTFGLVEVELGREREGRRRRWL